MEKRSDGFIEMEERYAGYEVYDRHGEKIGKVDDLFVDENDQPEYVGVKMGFLGTRSTLIPMEAVRVDEGHKRIEVSVGKNHVKEGPAFDDDWEITPPFEESVRHHYGLGISESAAARGAYGSYHEDVGEERRRVEKEPIDDAEKGSAGFLGGGSAEERSGPRADDAEGRSSREEHPPEAAGTHQRGSDRLRDEDELRVQRSEEELVAGTREREAGRMNVRKRVRTDREQVRVPTQREEVSVERVPVDEEAPAGAEIGEDEVSVPVVEEEAVVDKRAEVKEEVRLRKDVVEDEQVVEEDVRREEVDIEDSTERGQGLGDDDAARGR